MLMRANPSEDISKMHRQMEESLSTQIQINQKNMELLTVKKGKKQAIKKSLQ